MKKAVIMLALILLSIALFLTACSSPKSEFMSSFRNIIKNKQYTAMFTLQPTVITGFESIETFNPDALEASNLTIKTSRDSERDLTYNTYGLHVGGAPTMDLTAHSYKNGTTGKTFVPIKDFFELPVSTTQMLDLATNSVFSNVLSENQNLQAKYLDLLPTLQNVTNQVIDEKTVEEQSEQIFAIEKKAGFLLYKQLNGLDKSHYQTKNGTIELTLNKKELAELANAWLEAFHSDNDFIRFYAEILGITESQAKIAWSATNKEALESLKQLLQDDHIKLSTVLTLHPDSDKGIKKLIMAVDYKNTTLKQQLKFDFTMELLNFEKIPASPSKSEIITKQELDKVVTDVLREQRK